MEKKDHIRECVLNTMVNNFNPTVNNSNPKKLYIHIGESTIHSYWKIHFDLLLMFVCQQSIAWQWQSLFLLFYE